MFPGYAWWIKSGLHVRRLCIIFIPLDTTSTFIGKDCHVQCNKLIAKKERQILA